MEEKEFIKSEREKALSRILANHENSNRFLKNCEKITTTLQFGDIGNERVSRALILGDKSAIKEAISSLRRRETLAEVLNDKWSTLEIEMRKKLLLCLIYKPRDISIDELYAALQEFPYELEIDFGGSSRVGIEVKSIADIDKLLAKGVFEVCHPENYWIQLPPTMRMPEIDTLFKNPQYQQISIMITELPTPLLLIDIQRLPDNLSIYSGLSIFNSPDLKSLPKNLYLNGGLHIVNCPNLEIIDLECLVAKKIKITDNTPVSQRLRDQFEVQIETAVTKTNQAVNDTHPIALEEEDLEEEDYDEEEDLRRDQADEEWQEIRAILFAPKKAAQKPIIPLLKTTEDKEN